MTDPTEEGVDEHSVKRCRRITAIQKMVQEHIVHFDKRPFGTCCQAAHTKAICSHCCVSCVLIENKRLWGSNGIELRRSLLGDLASVVSVPHQSVITVFTYVQINRAEEETLPSFRITSPFNPGAKSTLNLSFHHIRGAFPIFHDSLLFIS